MYLRLGRLYIEHPAREQRQERMRRSIMENAEILHKRGLDSRIPFLKYAFLGQDVPPGSTAKAEDGVPVPHWGKGTVIRDDVTMDEVQRFNIFNAGRGLQALRGRKDASGNRPVLVVGCTTVWRGDLRMSFVQPESGVDVPYGAVYNHHWNQAIFDESRPIFVYMAVHEVEHARHSNLAFMCGMDVERIPLRKKEYLAMLAETIHTPDIPMVHMLLGEKPARLRNADQLPHMLASFYFMARLMVVHRMGLSSIEAAHGAWTHMARTGEKSDDPHLRRISACAMEDYRKAYEKMFALSFDDIQGVIDALPMI